MKIIKKILVNIGKVLFFLCIINSIWLVSGVSIFGCEIFAGTETRRLECDVPHTFTRWFEAKNWLSALLTSLSYEGILQLFSIPFALAAHLGDEGHIAKILLFDIIVFSLIAGFTVSKVFPPLRKRTDPSVSEVFASLKWRIAAIDKKKLVFRIFAAIPALLVIGYLALFFEMKAGDPLSKLVYSAVLSCKNVPSEEQYLERAAEEGNMGAQLRLAYLYQNGSPKKAFGWFLKAAEQGNPSAQNMVGLAYAPDLGSSDPYGRDGDKKIAKEAGFPKDYKQAFKWFGKAAEQGNTASQYYLSLLYRDGRGVNQSSTEAYFWMSLVAKQYWKYRPDQEEIGKKLTQRELDDVADRLDDWQPARAIPKEQQPLLNVAALMCGRSAGCQVTDQCGYLVGIDCGSAGDGPYYFANKWTKKVVAQCSFWQGACKPPLGWICGRPTGYH